MKTKENQEIQALKLELKRAKLQLKEQEKFANLGRKLSSIGHDINSPTSLISLSIRGILSRLAKIQNNQKKLQIFLPEDIYQDLSNDININEIIERLDNIEYQNSRTKRMIEDLRDYSIQNKYENNIETVSLDSLINKIWKNSYEFIKSKNIVESEKSQVNVVLVDKPIEVSTDKFKLSRILNNLFDNAFYSCLAKKSCNKFYQPEIKINIKEGNSEIIFIEIEDNGDGIPENFQKVIFEPFVSFKTKKVYGNTGLGLSIVQELVESLKGLIELESEYGKYARFKLTLPKKIDD